MDMALYYRGEGETGSPDILQRDILQSYSSLQCKVTPWSYVSGESGIQATNFSPELFPPSNNIRIDNKNNNKDNISFSAKFVYRFPNRNMWTHLQTEPHYHMFIWLFHIYSRV
jgi:hypothetical protein